MMSFSFSSSSTESGSSNTMLAEQGARLIADPVVDAKQASSSTDPADSLFFVELPPVAEEPEDTSIPVLHLTKFAAVPHLNFGEVIIGRKKVSFKESGWKFDVAVRKQPNVPP